MELFFERINADDRQGAIALMDEKAEMIIHVGDSAQKLRGVERVGGWFLRADRGLKMLPGDVRDTGNTYEADVLVIRPGVHPAPRRHLPGRGRQDHRDQPRPALGVQRGPRRVARCAAGEGVKWSAWARAKPRAGSSARRAG
jgi:hypothetical protein